MFAGLPSLSHEQQQKAVERIQELMSGDEQRTGNYRCRRGDSRQSFRRADRGAFRR